MRRLVADTDARAAVGSVVTLRNVVDSGMRENLRLRFFLLLFSGLGLALGAVGIYGVVSYAVERRRAEFGIRMALGAAPGTLLGRVVRVGMAPVLAGTVVGVGAALVAARILEGILFQVAPGDPGSFAAAAAVLLGVGVTAALLPAWRASRTDPATALRAE